MSGFTEIREYLAEALADDTQYKMFNFPPATLLPNSVVLAPASPWIEPFGPSKTVMVHWTVSIYANAADNLNDLVTLENMVTTVIANIPGGVAFSEVSQPQVIELTNTMLTTCDITLSVAVNIED